MKLFFFGAISVFYLMSCSTADNSSSNALESSMPINELGSGIDLSTFDTSVKPGDDFFRYAQGKWLETTVIPEDKSRYGTFNKLADEAELHLLAIIKEAASDKSATSGSEQQKVGDLYSSFMNEAAANTKGVKPLGNLLSKIDSISSKQDLPLLMAELGRHSVGIPLGMYINQDAKNPQTYITHLWQSGLGLPDRDYYLDMDNPKFKEVRAEYLVHLENMLTFIGYESPKKSANKIMQLETQIATISWTKVENRNRDKTYNKVVAADIPSITPDFDIKNFLNASGVKNPSAIIVSQPSFFKELARLIGTTDLVTLKDYLNWLTISSFASYLTDEIVAENFNFYGKVLSGTKENLPRWKRGVKLVEGGLGEVLGKIYVDRHFPPESKARMDVLVNQLIKAYRQSITELEWMGEETRQKALEKLSKFTVKIGYPSKWKDYSNLEISKDDLVGNVKRSRVFEHNRSVAKLGQEVDKEEWHMTPQTVNAYYNPVANEIVFPAAILQPPFFNPDAEEAVNYGGIGSVIGHEIGHGFDDQGSKYDGDGVLNNWWTDDDRENFVDRTKALSGQYSQFCPLGDGQPCVNGDLTIGENIGDLGGLSIAIKAYHRSLEGKKSLELDGFTGTQRVLLGWAQVWPCLYREERLLAQVKTGPHSPCEFRVNGVMRNVPEWYEAFDVKEDNALYLPPEARVKIW